MCPKIQLWSLRRLPLGTSNRLAFDRASASKQEDQIALAQEQIAGKDLNPRRQHFQGFAPPKVKNPTIARNTSQLPWIVN